jgi:hypothetical protein
MVEAYVLVNAEPGRVGRAVSRKIGAIEGVLSAEDLSPALPPSGRGGRVPPKPRELQEDGSGFRTP